MVCRLYTSHVTQSVTLPIVIISQVISLLQISTSCNLWNLRYLRYPLPLYTYYSRKKVYTGRVKPVTNSFKYTENLQRLSIFLACWIKFPINSPKWIFYRENYLVVLPGSEQRDLFDRAKSGCLFSY